MKRIATRHARDDTLRREDLSFQVRQLLRDLFSKSGDTHPAAVCLEVEGVLQDLAASAIVEELWGLAKDRGVRLEYGGYPERTFLYGQLEYEILFSPDPTGQPILHVSVCCATRDKREFREQKIECEDINGTGTYGETWVHVEAVFNSRKEGIAEVVSTVFESGYRWLQEHMMGFLREHQSQTSTALYKLVRQIFPESTAGHVWLYAVVGKKGSNAEVVALADDVARWGALHLSSIQDVVKLFTARIPLIHTFSQSALTQGSTLEYDFTAAPYKAYGVHRSERVVYQSPRLAVQPLIREGNILMTAGYPAVLRPLVEPRLEAEQEEIRRSTIQSFSSLEKVVQWWQDNVGRPSLELAQVHGAFLGAAGVEIAKHLNEI